MWEGRRVTLILANNDKFAKLRIQPQSNVSHDSHNLGTGAKVSAVREFLWDFHPFRSGVDSSDERCPVEAALYQ